MGIMSCLGPAHDFAPSGGYSRCARCGVKVSPCPLTFRSAQCGYLGRATECDKTPKRCRQLGNFAWYAGHTTIPERT